LIKARPICSDHHEGVPPEGTAVSSSSSPSSPGPSSPTPAPTPATPKRKTGRERRRATRVPLNSSAELIRVPSSSRTAPIKVKVRDVSATGVGIQHTEALPLGEKYVVKESTISRRKNVLFTVVRADQLGENNYSIGLHDTHLMGRDYRVEKRHARTAAMAKLLIIAIVAGGLAAVAWTFV
jgi:hypothetical protein